MNLKGTSLIVFISFFPSFIFRSNLNFIEIIISLIIFLAPFLLANYFFSKKLNEDSLFAKLYITSILTIGIDNNLGLWNGVIQPFKIKLIDFFNIIYFPSVILLLIVAFLIFLILKYSDKKIHNVLGVFLVTIFIFNLFDQTKSHTKIKDYSGKNINTKYKSTDVIIIFDEMSGLNSFESETIKGKEFNRLASSLYKKFNFNYYSNINSISENSVTSISSLLNFSNNGSERLDVTSLSKNYFYEYELNKNIFFSKFKNISVYQNIHIDYCLMENISKCKTYNPFNQNIFLDGFKNTNLSKLVSIWKLNGSIISTLTWRSLREINIINSILEPEGHKASFGDFFTNLESDIYSEKYDLIFAHTLVPHRPYGFDSQCKYDNKLSLGNTFYSIEKHRIQHNIERKCVFKYLENFLNNLETNNYLNKINLTILSDHGARIKRGDESYLSVIYAYRDQNTKFKNIKDKVISQNIFMDKYN